MHPPVDWYWTADQNVRGLSTHYPLYDFDLRATHARTLLPAALASVSFGFVLVRVRVGVLMLIERAVRKPIRTRATAQSYSQSSMILRL